MKEAIAYTEMFCVIVGPILIACGSNWKLGLGVGLLAYYLKAAP